jgi:hypothetical protein
MITPEPRRPNYVDPAICAHFYRKGYYVDSNADYCCVLCGHEVVANDTAPMSDTGDEI